MESPDGCNTLVTLPVRHPFELRAKFLRCTLENQANPTDVSRLLILGLGLVPGLSGKQWPS